MKYLKLFEAFVSPEEVKSNCEDILLELKDLGFTSYITIDGQWVKGKDFAREPKSWIRVRISKVLSYESLMYDGVNYGRRESFEIGAVIEYINRLDDYLIEIGFQTNDDFGSKYNIRTDVKRNPNDFSVIGLNSFVDLWYSRKES